MVSFDLKVRDRSQNMNWFQKQLHDLNEQRMNTPFGALILIAMVLTMVVGMSYQGYKLGIALAVACAGAPVFVLAVANARAGLYMVFAISFFVLGIKRFMEAIPVGLAMDIMIAGTFLGVLARQIARRATWKWAHNAVAYMVAFWILLVILQLFNPIAASRMAWVYTMRSTAGFLVMYYVTLYAITKTEHLDFLVKMWIGLALLVVLYGFKQEYIGLARFEMDWIMADSERYGLLFIMGRFRKFSFLSDPMIYGIFMALSSVFCFILASGPYSRQLKLILVGLAVAFFIGMLHSGTRAAYLAFPAGLMLYSTLSLNRNVLITTAVVFGIGYVLAKVPTSNLNLIRFQTAFRPEEDESYKVREANKRFIKPFIQNLPFGAGLGSVGVWGKRFGSVLADFPPDSGFVRIAVEQGYVSLFFYLVLIFVAFNKGVTNHFKIKDPKLRTYSLAFLAGMLSLTLANFPQEAIGQIPNNLIFFLMLAMSSRLYDLDKGGGEVDHDMGIQTPSRAFNHGTIGTHRRLVGASQPF